MNLLNKRVSTPRGKGLVIGYIGEAQVIVLHDDDVRQTNPIWCWAYPVDQVELLPEIEVME